MVQECLFHITSEFQATVESDSEFRLKPVLPVGRLVFKQIAEPIDVLLQNDSTYGKYETGVAFQIEAALRLAQSAWVKEVNPDKSAARTKSGNALQAIVDVLRDDPRPALLLDMGTIYDLVKYRHALDDAAAIHKNFMGNSAQAQALHEFSARIEDAQSRNWTPAPPTDFDYTAPAANAQEYRAGHADIGSLEELPDLEMMGADDTIEDAPHTPYLDNKIA